MDRSAWAPLVAVGADRSNDRQRANEFADRSTRHADSPLVSVIVPTHDRPERLRRAVRSVFGQTYAPIELFVVDDASARPARPVVEETVGNVSKREDGLHQATEIVRFDENRGGAAARNAGIERASGEYVAFLDDDDRWDPAKLERQIDRLESASEDVGLCYTRVVQLDDGAVSAISPATAEGELARDLLTINVVGTISSVVVRRAVVETVGGLDPRFPSWQDWAYYLRVAESYRFCSVDEPLTVRHNAGGQLSGDYWTKRDETAPLFRRTFSPMAAQYGGRFERRFDASVEYHLGLAAIRADEFAAARRHFARAVRTYPRAPVFTCYLGAVSGGRWTYGPLYALGSILPIRRVKRALQ
ncbi:glycosyltransferase family 2 protein [Halovivax gelatinilyticus]|uniref:glycosyltransferase family 2 protein n=1 Tax=Halovivax gelatinilyticus TaxID=2961597 RepID=UPI0020CA87B2|nr:glycosyltransferase family 2 protein [Halovivax gelatinilyticus]